MAVLVDTNDPSRVDCVRAAVGRVYMDVRVSSLAFSFSLSLPVRRVNQFPPLELLSLRLDVEPEASLEPVGGVGN